MVFVGPAQASAVGARVPVLLELFTSEGCSSCPPADALLATLEATQPVDGAEIIPIAWHIDYWNRLGWTDRFSAADYTRRQYGYAQAKGWNQVYTPQAIVQGMAYGVGSDASSVKSLVFRATQQPVVRLGVALAGSAQGCTIRVQGLKKGVALNLVLLESGLVSQVMRGENAGTTLEHQDVVRLFHRDSASSGSTARWQIPSNDLSLEGGPLKAVAWQQDGYGPVESVGQSKILTRDRR